MGHSSAGVRSSECSVERYGRLLERKKQKDRHDAAAVLLQIGQALPVPDEEDETTKECQTDVTGDFTDSQHKKIAAENKQLKETIEAQAKELESVSVTEDSLRDDEAKLGFYTGLVS